MGGSSRNRLDGIVAEGEAVGKSGRGCGKEAASRSGPSPSTGPRPGLDTAAAQRAEDDRPRGAEGSPVERALAELGIEWKDVMAFGVHSDRVVIIEGPVGYKRVYALPGAGELEE